MAPEPLLPPGDVPVGGVFRSRGDILLDTFFRSLEDVAAGYSPLILFDGFHSGIFGSPDRACGDIVALGPDSPDGRLEGVNSFAAGLKENLETLILSPSSAWSRGLPFAAVGIMPMESCLGIERVAPTAGASPAG